MAAYQFVIGLVPNERIKKNTHDTVNLLMADGEYDASISWEGYEVPCSIDHLISVILPETNSWHKDLRIWGEEENTDIQIWFCNGRPESITIRLDLRGQDEELKLKFINLAKKLNCDFFIPERKKLINTCIEDLNSVIDESKAKKFVRNPEKFLNDLDNKKNKY